MQYTPMPRGTHSAGASNTPEVGKFAIFRLKSPVRLTETEFSTIGLTITMTMTMILLDIVAGPGG